MAEKATVMVLKVNLQCPCCNKKVTKILRKFPQISNPVYDEKANTVTITVVYCNPEKLRDKLCRKGRKVIKSIEINPKPQPPSRPPRPPGKDEGTQTCVSQKHPATGTCCGSCSEGCYDSCGVPPPPQPCCDWYYGYWHYGYGYCASRGFHVCKCDFYLCHDDPPGCYVM